MARASLLARVAVKLARWLRRLAIRIEASAGVIPSAPLVLDALANRFPGAPAHWLEAIAQHLADSDLTEPADSIASEPPPLEVARPDAASRRSTFASSRARSRAGEAVRFATLKRPDRAPKSFAALHPRPRAALRWIMVARRETQRPVLISEGSIGPRRRIVSPHLPLSLTTTVAPRLHLGAPPARDRAPPSLESFTSSDRPLVPASELPLVESWEASSLRLPIRAGRSDFSAPEEPSLFEATLAPSPRSSRRHDPAFMPTIAATRCSLDFVGHDPRWPSLPPVSMSIEDALPPALALPALRDEQRYGSWSA